MGKVGGWGWWETGSTRYIDNLKRDTSSYTGMHQESRKPEDIFGPPEQRGPSARRADGADSKRQWAEINDEPSADTPVGGGGSNHGKQDAGADMKQTDMATGGLDEYREDEVDWGTVADAEGGPQDAPTADTEEDISTDDAVSKALAGLSTQIQQRVTKTLETATKTLTAASRKKATTPDARKSEAGKDATAAAPQDTPHRRGADSDDQEGNP